jgi:ATP-dependent Clp protease ATP-binding subunit ClpA
MVDLEFFTDRIAESGRHLIRQAYDEAIRRGNSEIVPEHIMKAFASLERPFFNRVMEGLNLDPQAVLQALDSRLGHSHHSGRSLKMSQSFVLLMNQANRYAQRRHLDPIEAVDLFVACVMDERNSCVKLFTQFGAERATVMEMIERQMRRPGSTDSQPPSNQRGHQ